MELSQAPACCTLSDWAHRLPKRVGIFRHASHASLTLPLHPPPQTAAPSGERIRFATPSNATAAAKERASIFGLDVMTKFAAHGFSYIGHAPLSHAPLRRKVAWLKEAAFAAATAAKTAGSAAAGSAARVASAAASVARAAAGAATAPSPPAFDAGASLDSIRSFAQPPASGQQVKVEIVRGDRFGNVFYKT